MLPVSCVTPDPVMVGGHDSMDDLAVSLSTVVTCNLDESTMVEELSGVSKVNLLHLPQCLLFQKLP